MAALNPIVWRVLCLVVVLVVIATGFIASLIVTVYCQCFPQALGFNGIGQPQEDSEPADIKEDQEMKPKQIPPL